MKSRPLLRILFLLIGLLGFFSAAPCLADYDPNAETERLIAKATEDLEKDKELSAKVEADMKDASASFGEFNGVEESLNGILAKCRTLDANNRFKVILTLGVNIALNVFVSKNQLAEGVAKATQNFLLKMGKHFATEELTTYINEKWPGIWSDGSTMKVGSTVDSTIRAVEEFNVALKMNYVAVEAYIRRENAELAEKEGPLNANLLILKHSEIIDQKGTLAINALKQLKADRLEKYKVLAKLKGAVDIDIKRLEEDIRSWKRNLGLNDELKKANEWSKSPDTVTFPVDSNYDFGTAASNMKQAWQKLVSGEYSCSSYHGALWDATKGAQTQLNELLRPIYAAAAACGTDACWRHASAAAANVYRAFESQVRGTSKQLHEDAKALADGPIHSFGQSLHKWDQNEVDMVVWGEDHKVKMDWQHGDWLGMAIWQYALSTSGGSAVTPRFYALSVKRLAQSEKLLQNWQDDAKSVKDYFQKRADSAKSSAGVVTGLSSTATQLAGKLQPNIELWDCFRSEGSYGYDPVMVNFEHVRGQYDRLAHFEAAFSAVSRDGEDAGRQLIEAASKNVELTNKVVEALRGVAPVKEKADKFVTSAKELRSVQDGNLDISGGQIYAILGHYGVSDSGLKALDERIKALSDPATLEKEALSQIPGMPGFDFKNQVLTKEGIAGLKTSVNKALASIDSARDRYASAYKNVQEAETSLDGVLQTMRDKLAPIFPEEVPYFFKDAVLGEYSEPEEHLALLLRDRVGPAEQLPDSGLGSGPLIERYTVLAERYHALVDPMMPVARANRFAPDMEEMLKKLKADSGRLQGLDNNAFMNESNRYSNDAYLIYQKASNEGAVAPKSRLSVAYGAIIGALSEISSAYYQRQRLSEAQSSLRNAIDGINTFLGNPEAMGGWSAAQQWMDSIGYTKGAVDASVKNHPTIQALMGQLDGLMDKLKELASRVDSSTLQKDTQAIQAMYADFVRAYQSKNLTALTHFLASGWQAADGSNVDDLETNLSNSFRVFDSIVFKISGLNIQRTANFYQVSYQAALTGRISRLKKSHEETANVVDTVVITPDGPRIQKTTGMLH